MQLSKLYKGNLFTQYIVTRFLVYIYIYGTYCHLIQFYTLMFMHTYITYVTLHITKGQFIYTVHIYTFLSVHIYLESKHIFNYIFSFIYNTCTLIFMNIYITHIAYIIKNTQICQYMSPYTII